MKLNSLIEKYFWIVLVAGICMGLWLPLPFIVPGIITRVLLGLMLFTVFLKIDVLEVLDNIKNFRLMFYISVSYMIIIPLAFYFIFRLFGSGLAIGILLLTSMPAGVSSPALTDIARGNVPLAMSIALITQLIAPLTVPFLFWLVNYNDLNINEFFILRDIALQVFIPLIAAQIAKRTVPDLISRKQHFFTSFNIFLLFTFVYIAISPQSSLMTGNPLSLLWRTVILYFVFAVLHFIGYYMAPKEKRENRIAMSVTSAYMNNGLAIVLAAAYFTPDILILMVLSELPWNTMLAPFVRVINSFQKAN
jgi:bile acid:Na+ symporter, BASS family